MSPVPRECGGKGLHMIVICRVWGTQRKEPLVPPLELARAGNIELSLEGREEEPGILGGRHRVCKGVPV